MLWIAFPAAWIFRGKNRLNKNPLKGGFDGYTCKDHGNNAGPRRCSWR
jgi:hypothetical protein